MFAFFPNKPQRERKIIVKIARIVIDNFMFSDLHASPKMLDFKLCKRIFFLK